MLKSCLESKVKTIFSSILKIEDVTMISDELCYESIPTWDSLNHLHLLMALEEEFNIEFTVKQIAALRDFKSICYAIQTMKH